MAEVQWRHRYSKKRQMMIHTILTVLCVTFITLIMGFTL